MAHRLVTILIDEIERVALSDQTFTGRPTACPTCTELRISIEQRSEPEQRARTELSGDRKVRN